MSVTLSLTMRMERCVGKRLPCYKCYHCVYWIQIHVGKIIACVKTSSACSYCIIETLSPLMSGSNSISNEMDCPLLQGTDHVTIVPSIEVKTSISVVHECTSTCGEVMGRETQLEREHTVLNVKTIRHDSINNNVYCLNLYCTNYSYH